jgi:hypothetical protein
MFRGQTAMFDCMPGWKRLAVLSGILLAGVALMFLLSRGTAGGDEGAAIRYAALAKAEGWVALLNGRESQIAAHRLFWTGEKYLLDFFFTLLLPAWLYAKPLVHDAVLTLDGPLFMLAAAATGWLFAARRHDGRDASLAVSALLLGSSAISFFVGGDIECMMLLLVTLLTVALHPRQGFTPARLVAALVCGACLIACKVYSLVFLLPLAFLIPIRRYRFCFAAILILATGAWLVIPAMIGHHEGAAGFYLRVLGGGNIGVILGRAADQVVSFGFGLLWCFPLLAFLLPVRGGNRKALLVKATGLFLLILVFALFPFAYGQGAAAGPRYSVPFLMAFLPEVAEGVALLRRRRPVFLLAAPLAVLLFLPAIDYHNSLIGRWVDVPVRSIAWPSDDVRLQPGVFAWRVTAAKQVHQSAFRPSPEMPYDVPVTAIIPMTGLSRIIYVLENLPTVADSKTLALAGWLWRHGLATPWPWRMLRGLLALALLVWVSWAALPLRRAATA